MYLCQELCEVFCNHPKVLRKMNWVDIIGLIASVITILALWGNLSAMYYNCRHFWKGGCRITYYSGAYVIKGGGINGKTIYKSSVNEKDYFCYAEVGRMLCPEPIKPFWKWNKAHWVDDIREPKYPLQLL